MGEEHFGAVGERLRLRERPALDRLLEFLQNPALLAVEIRRHFNDDPRIDVSAAAATDRRHSFAAQTENLAVGRPCGNLKSRLALGRRYRHLASERGRDRRNGNVDEEVLSLTLEKIARALKDMGVSERVIIHMPETGVCLSDNGFFELPSWDLPKGFIKGKTGAGDAFCAGALIGIYRGLDEMGILTLAQKTATASLSSADAIGGMVSEAEIDEMLTKMNIKF